MKSLIIVPLFAIFLLYSCGEKPVEITEVENQDSLNTELISDLQQVVGSYVGSFGTNKMTLLVTTIKQVKGVDSVYGRSIVAMNDRPFSGVFSKKTGKLELDVKEPGTDAYDGAFHLVFDPKEPLNITGSWKPNNPKQAEKQFSFVRNRFKYDPKAGRFPVTSERLLDEDDCLQFAKEDLFIMRNEIFARHGYIFYKKKTREIFEKEDWYVPFSTDVKNDLTKIEKANVEMIQRYEKYAEEYGDYYGR